MDFVVDTFCDEIAHNFLAEPSDAILYTVLFFSIFNNFQYFM